MPLSTYRGRVLLIVNVASQCGFTPQYAGLQALQDRLGPQGLTVMGFPCNQFGGQEPGTDADIQGFCQSTYGVTFPVFARIDVDGPGADPLYQYLTAQKGGLMGKRIRWNFTKFLVGRDGEVMARMAPVTKPEKIRHRIEAALSA